MKKLKQILTEQKGTMFPLPVAVSIGLLFLLLAIVELMHLYIMCDGIKDAMESAIISVVNDNYNEVYHSVREGYAAGYEPGEGSFFSSIDEGQLEDRLCRLLGLSQEEDGLVKLNENGEIQYLLSDLTSEVHNTQLRNSGERFYASGSVTVHLPVRFGNKITSYAEIQLKCKAAYTEIF